MEDYKKKYEEALERARVSRLQLIDIGEEATEIEYIFPELKVSEDERIRMALIDYFDDMKKANERASGIHPDTILAWLEKQDPCDGCNNVKGCVICVDGSENAKIQEEETV